MRHALPALLLAACGGVGGATPDAPDAPPDMPPSIPDDPPAEPVAASAATAITPFVAPHASFTKVQYANEAYDDRGELAGDRFTAAATGDYQICASLARAALTFELDVFVNGQREKAIAYGTGGVTGCRTVHLAEGDYAEVWVHQESGTQQTFTFDPFWSWWSIHGQPLRVAADTVATFSAGTSAFTRVPYDAEHLDVHGELDPATHRFTPALAGDYRVCASLLGLLSGIGTGAFELDLFRNGQRERGFAYGSGVAGGCRTIRLVAGDRLDVSMYHVAGTTVSLSPNGAWNWLSIEPVRGAASLGDTTTFAAPHATFTRIAYAAELHDDGDSYDVSASRYRAALAGDYEICASLYIGTATTAFELDLFKNDTRELGFAYGTGIAEGCRVIRLAAGDHVDVRLYQASGSAMTIRPNVFWNWMTIRRVT